MTGLFDPPMLSRDGSRVYYTLSTPRMPTSVYAFDARTGVTRRLTDAPVGVPVGRLAPAESHTVTSFDGESVPVFVFRPQRGLSGDVPASPSGRRSSCSSTAAPRPRRRSCSIP